MCPTSRTTHLGGTPLESGEAGGHIRKTWVSAFDAALAGLHADIRGDQCLHLGLGFGGEHVQRESGELVFADDVFGQIAFCRQPGEVFVSVVVAGPAEVPANSLNRRELLVCKKEVVHESKHPMLETGQPDNITHVGGRIASHGSGPRVVNQRASGSVRPLLVLHTHPRLLRAEVFAANLPAALALDLWAVLSRDALGALPVSDCGLLQFEKARELFLTTYDLGGFFDGLDDIHSPEYRLPKPVGQPA